MSNSPIGNTNNQAYPQNLSPNAVSINIFNPSAFGQGVNPSAQNPIQQDNFYSLYGQNTNPNAQLYPQNYNNMVQYNPYQYNLPQQNPAQNQNPSQTSLDNSSNMAQNPSKIEKTSQEEPKEATDKKDEKTEKKKEIVPLTDEYIKSLENYLDDSNPKIRLIAAKDILERFKEDENRKDNPSLIPLLNKILRDTSPSVRFLGLTTLDLGYCAGDNETVEILKEMQKTNDDKAGQNQLLASEILLKMSHNQVQGKEA